MALLTPSPRHAAALAVGLLLLAALPLHGQPDLPIENNVKAVFLYKVAKYVTWPSSGTGERRADDIRICVTSENGFFTLLRSGAQGEDVDGRPITPVALTGLDDARTCHILYVGDSTTPDARAWFRAVRNTQVLTVGDGSDVDEPVIAFVRAGNRVRFDINRAAGDRHGLTISSKLLRLARQVKDF